MLINSWLNEKIGLIIENNVYFCVMARKKTKEIQIATLNNINIDELCNKHIQRVSMPNMLNADDVFIAMGVPAQPVYGEKPTNIPKGNTLYPKYIALIHVLIMRCRASKQGVCHISAELLQDVFGNHYPDMLITLSFEGLISIGDYEVGKKTRYYSLLPQHWKYVTYTSTKNIKVIEYINRIDVEYINNQQIKNYKEDDFTIRYNNSLSLNELILSNNAIDYINSRNDLNPQQYHYYIGKIEEFNTWDKKITSIDDNGRIYHYFTNLPKSLKSFFSIKLEIDISNSHPLLFSKFIIDYYKISNNILYDLLFNIDFIEVYNSHYSTQELHKILKDKNIDAPHIPIDVLLYIWDVSKGTFWNSLTAYFEGVERGEVKQQLFAQVFYANTLTMRNKAFGKVFKEHYPNVWKVIKGIKWDCINDEEGVKLPCQMMQLESSIFRGILNECYNRGWNVFNIHDSIVVPDAEVNEGVTAEELTAIIKDEYKKYGLHPSVSTK